jgi:hypothetical protein
MYIHDLTLKTPPAQVPSQSELKVLSEYLSGKAWGR